MKQVNATLSYMQLLQLFREKEKKKKKNNRRRISPGALVPFSGLVHDGNNEYVSAC